jgi:hypothetical protein
MMAGPTYGAHIVKASIPMEMKAKAAIRAALLSSPKSNQDVTTLGTVFGPGHRWFYSAQALLRGAQGLPQADAADRVTIRDIWHHRGRITQWDHRGPVGSFIVALRAVGGKWDSFQLWDTEEESIPWTTTPWPAVAHDLRRLWRYAQWQSLSETRRYEFSELRGRSVDRVATQSLMKSLISVRDKGVLRLLLTGGLVAAWRRGIWHPASRGGQCPHCTVQIPDTDPPEYTTTPREHYEHRFRHCPAWAAHHEALVRQLADAASHFSGSGLPPRGWF